MILHGNLYLVISLFWYSGYTSNHFKKNQITKEDMRNKGVTLEESKILKTAVFCKSQTLRIWLKAWLNIKLWSHKFPLSMAFSDSTKCENLVKLTSATLLLILILIFLWFTVLNWIPGEFFFAFKFQGWCFHHFNVNMQNSCSSGSRSCLYVYFNHKIFPVL